MLYVAKIGCVWTPFNASRSASGTFSNSQTKDRGFLNGASSV